MRYIFGENADFRGPEQAVLHLTHEVDASIVGTVHHHDGDSTRPSVDGWSTTFPLHAARVREQIAQPMVRSAITAI